jgi:hypothetical protein
MSQPQQQTQQFPLVYYRMVPLNPQDGIVAGSRDIGVGRNCLSLNQGKWYQARLSPNERAFLEAQRQYMERPQSKPLLEFYRSQEEVMEVVNREREILMRKLQNLPNNAGNPFQAAQEAAPPSFTFDPSRMSVVDVSSKSVPTMQEATTFDPNQFLKDHQEALDSADAIDAQGIAQMSSGVGNSAQSGTIGRK